MWTLSSMEIILTIFVRTNKSKILYIIVSDNMGISLCNSPNVLSIVIITILY